MAATGWLPRQRWGWWGRALRRLQSDCISKVTLEDRVTLRPADHPLRWLAKHTLAWRNR